MRCQKEGRLVIQNGVKNPYTGDWLVSVHRVHYLPCTCSKNSHPARAGLRDF